MNYIVFFAYQSDIPEKYGKKFIQDAMNKTISRFKNEDNINLELDYGMRKTAGNPILIEEMLRKSRNSDLVLVDLTYTSSKEWFEAERLDEDETKTIYKILKGQDRKPSPNPNVLLEAGYAWAHKGYDRTVFLMNTHYGLPDELPVDLKGFRWAIPFDISEGNYSDSKAVRGTLSDDLYNAIKSAINSEADYQRKLWNPIRLHKDWRPKDFNRAFIPTKNAKSKISQLRIDLENTEIAQRIVGPKSSGKTRLAYELYKEIDDSLPKHDNLEKVLYYDLDGGDYRSIESKLLDLRELNQRKILMLDNCSIKIHNKVFEEFFYDTEISVLSIGDTEDGDGASVFLDKDYASETIEKISNEAGNPGNTEFIVQTSKGNLRNAIAMIGKIPEGAEGLSLDYEPKWRQILGEKLYSSNTMLVLEELSLLSHVGITGIYQNQSDIICKNSDLKLNDFLEIVDELSETGIVKVTGDFVILEAFIEELALARLKRMKDEDFGKYFNILKDLKLTRQFSQRLVQLNKLIGSTDFINQLSEDGGVLTKESFVTSDQGARILMSLAEFEPNLVMNILNSNLGDKSYQELSELKDGRRNLVWTLERLVYRKETFHDAAKLLFLLAVAENEEIGNNSTAQFCQLFQPWLPGTTSSLKDRLHLLEKLVANPNDAEQNVLVKALDRGLMVRGFTRFSGADKQAGQKFTDYEPKSKQEVDDYYKVIIQHLLSIQAYEILTSSFNSQIHKGNAEAMITAIKKYLEQSGELDKDLRQQFEYLLNDSREIDAGVIDQIKGLIDQFTTDSIKEKLEYMVALAPYSAYKTEDGSIKNLSEDKAEELAIELVESGDDWLKEIDILLKGEQRLTFWFGRKIASLKDNYDELLNSCAVKLSSIPFENQNNSLMEGYLAGLNNEDFARKCIDLYLSKEEINYHAIRMTRFLKVAITDFEKLFPVLDQNPKFVAALQYLDLKSLSVDNFITVLDKIKEYVPFGWWLAIDLCQSNLEKQEEVSDKINAFIKVLLSKEGILKGNDSHTPFTMHQYVALLKIYCEKGIDNELAAFLANEIIEASKDVMFNHEYHLRDILQIILENKWDISWGVIGKTALESDFYGWYNLKGLFKKHKSFNDKKLMAWMDENPTEAPQKVVTFANLVNPDNDEEWSFLLMQMFDKYHTNQSFLAVLNSELHSYSYSGSAVPLLEKRKKLVELLKDHTHEEIRDFSKRNIEEFEDKIKREKRSDQNYGLDL